MPNPLDTSPLIGYNAQQFLLQQDGALPPFLALCDDDTTLGLGVAYYGPPGGDIAQSTGSPTVNNLQFVPRWSGCGGIINEVAFFNATVSGAGGVARCGIYNANQQTLLPTTLVVDGGSQATDAGTVMKNTVLNPVITLLPNTLYYTAYLAGVSSTGTVNTLGSGWHSFGRNVSGNAQFGLVKTGFAFAALPVVAPAPSAYLTSAPANVYVRWKSLFRP